MTSELIKQRTISSYMHTVVADALAMPFMNRPCKILASYFEHSGSPLNLTQALEGSPGEGKKVGSVTDVASLSSTILSYLLRQNASINVAGIKEALVLWKDSPFTSEYYQTYAGNATRRGIDIIQGAYEYTRFDKVPCDSRRISNGAASRAWVAGLMNPGNIDQAIRDAVTMSAVTHRNAIALSGAAIVAALVSSALVKKLTAADVYELAVSCAKESYKYAESVIGITSVGSKILPRLEIAAEIAVKYRHDEGKLLRDLNDFVGFGNYTSEVVPAAIGIVLAYGQDIKKSLSIAIAAGNNCNKTAAIVAAICGADADAAWLYDQYWDEVCQANSCDLRGVHKQLMEA